MSKSFTTAVKERQVVEEGEQEPGLLEFDLDGFPMVAHEPDPSQFAMLMHAAGRFVETRDAVSGFIDFFYNVLDRPSAQHVRTRMFDRKDDFGLDEVEEMVAWMVEEWTGRPMPRRSASTRSPKSTGPRSTRTSRQ